MKTRNGLIRRKEERGETMLSHRQLEILLELLENPGTYTTAAALSSSKEVSLRTIQSDMKKIREELEEELSLRLDSAARKGYCIYIRDADAYDRFKDRCYVEYSGAASMAGSERPQTLIGLLLQSFRPVSLFSLQNSLYVSESTLNNDLAAAGRMLQKYDLEIFRSQSKVMIEGSEISRRKAISELGFSADLRKSAAAENDQPELSKIRSLLVETLVEMQYPVTENALNNMVLQISVALSRMQKMFFIESDEFTLPSGLQTEQLAARQIMKKLENAFYLRIPEEEADYLALTLKAHANPDQSDLITEDMNRFVLQTLESIFRKTGNDLRDDLNARIALAVHCSSLLIRIQYDMQLSNPLKDHIRQNFPQGYDLAVLFAQNLSQWAGKPVTEDETAFLAIILYTALTNIHISDKGHRLLLVTSRRHSENILLRQSVLRWFEGQLSELKICRIEEVSEEDLDEFDVFATTEQNRLYDMGLAILIHPFPTQQDYLNLKIALDGFSSLEDVLSLFPEDLFLKTDETSKSRILEMLSEKAEEIYQLEGLKEAVFEREKIGSTYFGSDISGAHPMSPVSSDTFVAAALLSKPAIWDDEGHEVSLVLLIHIGRNNLKAFQLWNYLSFLFSDRDFADRMLQLPTYENFRTQLANLLADHL